MKNTPRDFFLHFGAFAALYLSAIALITLLFRMIDYVFPDESALYYADPYSGPMRFAIASLLILAPLFLWLMRMMQQEARKNPERRTLGVRRWLTYITLFIAGATIVIDLIVLLNSFLAGELVETFLLKVAVLLVIMGAGFWYFILDIHGHWQDREGASKMVGYGVLALILTTIIAGFAIMGSPSVQREIRLDQQQVQDLSMVQYQVVEYWRQNEALPAELAVLESDITGFMTPEAPADREPYTYEVRDNRTFALCATFARSSEEYGYSMVRDGYGIAGNTSWAHEEGRTCFERTIDPALVQPAARPF